MPKQKLTAEQVNERNEKVCAGWREFVETFFVQKNSFVFAHDKPILTQSAVEETKNLFIDHPDESGRSFTKKLPEQFKGSSIEAKLLILNIYYIHCLVSASTTDTKKKSNLTEPFPEELGNLNDKITTDYLGGICRTSQNFNSASFTNCSFIIEMIKDLELYDKQLKNLENITEKIIRYCWRNEDNHNAYAISSAVRYLSAPEKYEYIISKNDKDKIIAHYNNYLIGSDHIDDRDERIAIIRKELEKQNNDIGFDFYKEPYNNWKIKTYTEQPAQSGNVVQEDNMENDTSNNHPLNQILYGPPGTGKTYAAIDKALEILGHAPDKEERMQSFKELQDNGQIQIVTFHQNYSYEDFIEGIKPILNSEQIAYKLEDGIFKAMAKKARKNDNRVHIDIKKLIEKYAEHLEKNKTNNGELKEHLTQTSAIIKCRRQHGAFKSFRVQTGDQTRQSLTLELAITYYKEFLKGKLTKSGFANKRAPYYYPLCEKIKEFYDEMVNKKNYVLIIDEINRGNIAKIFGELITLIEPSKRTGQGQKEGLELTLPYSKEPFSVPDNLYIIGTMNTADRSIALLDTALRRRFVFEEMMPQPELLDNEEFNEQVALNELLTAINHRITTEHDRDHQIGHSYLMGINSMDDLKHAFQQKIIPLLQEYFFDDWEKINTVLNNNGFIIKTGDDDGDKTIYEKLAAEDPKWDNPDNYTKIYNGKQSSDNETN